MKKKETGADPTRCAAHTSSKVTNEDAAAILSRRDFLIASALAGCGLAIGGAGCPASAPQKVSEPVVTDDTVYEEVPAEAVGENRSSRLDQTKSEEKGEYDDLYPVELMNRAERSIEDMRTRLAGILTLYEETTDDYARDCYKGNIETMRTHLKACEEAYSRLRQAAAQNDLDGARRYYGEIELASKEFSYAASNADYCYSGYGTDVCLQPMMCLEYEDPQVCLW